MNINISSFKSSEVNEDWVHRYVREIPSRTRKSFCFISLIRYCMGKGKSIIS